MDGELEELESLLSGHFGRTPLNTPCCSQNSDVLEEDTVDTGDEQVVDVEDVVECRARDFLAHQGTHESFSDDEHAVDCDSGDMLAIRKLFKDGCGCSMECHTTFTKQEIHDHVLNIRDMEKEERDMYIMGTISESEPEKTKRGKKRQRMRYRFQFRGKDVCKRTFMVCFDVGASALKNMFKHLMENGISPRKHGNKGKVKSHALNFEDVQRVVRFITNHADSQGIPQPAAPRGRDNIPPVYLSADTTKCKLHSDYGDALTSADQTIRKVSLSAFKTIWLSCIPHIKIATPRDDVCAVCEKLRQKVVDAIDEESKLLASTDMRDHVLMAQQERDLYNSCIRRSMETRDANAEEKYTHFTFDYSQCVSLPHFARQMGPLYFLSLKKVQIFGFRIDGEPEQMNFLVDEGELMGGDDGDTHGPNSVLSMVDYALEQRGDDVTSFAIHADNCPGQNKNKYVLGYFAWRVMTGQNVTIEYLMQVPGHARCLIDGGFGHVKRLYRRTNCETMDELEALVNRSATSNVAVRYPQWQWRSWKAYLVQHFKPLTGIRKYQYFRFSDAEPGVVTVRERCDSCEVKICLLKDPTFRFVDSTRPIAVPSHGLTAERRLYLNRSVRPYVRPALQDDFCAQ